MAIFEAMRIYNYRTFTILFLLMGINCSARPTLSCHNYYYNSETYSNDTLLPKNDNPEKILSFWKKIKNKNKKSNNNTSSQNSFEFYIDKIIQIAKENKPIELTKPLKVRTSHPPYATLLYLLSQTHIGRKLIQTAYPYLSGKNQPEDNLHFRFLLKNTPLHGFIDYFSFADSTKPKIVLNKELKIGTALIVFAHEITHVINHAHFNIYNIYPNFNKCLALDEVIAYKTEQKVINEISEYNSFSNYRALVQNDPLNEIYQLDDTSIIIHLIKYNLTETEIREALRTYSEDIKNKN